MQNPTTQVVDETHLRDVARDDFIPTVSMRRVFLVLRLDKVAEQLGSGVTEM
jgi:hypothetical protein